MFGRIAARLRGKGPLPEDRLVWIFGSGRSGSTWLAAMLGELPGFAQWKEPLVGELFGHLYYERATKRMRSNPNFVLGRHREVWIPAVRDFVLANAAGRFPGASWVVAKEPNGSLGAPILSQAMPGSRLIFLVRDPRDVMASVLDAMGEGAWFHARRGESEHPFVREAGTFGRSLENAAAAYDGHAGPRALLRYEDLLANTTGELGRVCSELGLPAAVEDVRRAAGVHAWEKIPPEQKGAGKFYRKALPGSWREDLTTEQVAAVEESNGPIIGRFYPDGT